MVGFVFCFINFLFFIYFYHQKKLSFCYFLEHFHLLVIFVLISFAFHIFFNQIHTQFNLFLIRNHHWTNQQNPNLSHQFILINFKHYLRFIPNFVMEFTIVVVLFIPSIFSELIILIKIVMFLHPICTHQFLLPLLILINRTFYFFVNLLFIFVRPIDFIVTGGA